MQQPDSVRSRLLYAIVAVLAAMALTAAGLAGIVRAAKPEPSAQRALAVTPSASPRPARQPAPPPPLAIAPTATASPAAPATASPSTPAPPRTSGATAQMAALAASLPPSSVSVAARNLNTGATFAFGSSSGQTTASVVKVDILETLLLQVQKSGGSLTDDQDNDATVMIEDSDDDAADDLWEDIGGGSAMAAANSRLKVPCTVPGPGPEWGLTTTCAQGQVQILYQLENTSSPLNQSNRGYILNLMQNVTPDQVWGVSAVADPGTDIAIKNGWLNLSGNTDWAVTSDGIVTYHGQTLLIATLTQNNSTVYTGVTLVEQLAQLAAQSVTS